MNYVIDQLEERMVSVQNHDIAFIVFVVVNRPALPRGHPLPHLLC